MASYPGAVKSFTTKTASTPIASAHMNDAQDEIVAVEGALLNGVQHAIKPSSAGAQDVGTSALPWGTVHARVLDLDASSELTIATGAVTVTRSYHSIDTEGDAASDDLDTLTATGLTAGHVVIFKAENTARVVTFKDGSGNLLLNGDYALNATDRTITLLYDGTNWRELARSVTGANGATLLKAGSGTSTAAVATNVDTVAITGLTANDRLWVVYDVESAAQLTAIPLLYSVTDALAIVSLQAGQNIASGNQTSGEAFLQQRQSGATALRATSSSIDAAGSSTTPNIRADAQNVTLTTNWTGSWTLALRHGGVTAGGTFSWTWAVYRLAGQ